MRCSGNYRKLTALWRKYLNETLSQKAEQNLLEFQRKKDKAQKSLLRVELCILPNKNAERGRGLPIAPLNYPHDIRF